MTPAEQRLDRIVQRVAELPDRSSPEDWPEAMIVTAAELRGIVADELGAAPAANDAEREAFLPPFDHCETARDVVQQLGFEFNANYLSPKNQALVEHAASCIESLMRSRPAASVNATPEFGPADLVQADQDGPHPAVRGGKRIESMKAVRLGGPAPAQGDAQ